MESSQLTLLAGRSLALSIFQFEHIFKLGNYDFIFEVGYEDVCKLKFVLYIFS